MRGVYSVCAAFMRISMCVLSYKTTDGASLPGSVAALQ
jgi:hypothetical protein